MPDFLPRKLTLTILILSSLLGSSKAQTLKLRDAVDETIKNYPLIKAKQAYANSSAESVGEAKKDLLPNFSLGIQQAYGTINGQNGPSYGLNGLGTASSGPALASQNWNTAFGALYLSNLNWDFFGFGKVRQRIHVAEEVHERDEQDLNQELFQQKIRVSSAYLNLLAAQRLRQTQEKNLQRALTFKNTAVIRAMNGLIAGVDSSLAAAEVSSARIALNRAIDLEQEQANNLGFLMGKGAGSFIADTTSLSRIPASFFNDRTIISDSHPLLKFYGQRVKVSESQEDYLHRFFYPTFSFFSVLQGRGSGFRNTYGSDQTAFTRNYFTGINPVRSNYLAGVGVSWNLTSILRYSAQVKAQQFQTEGLKNEYELSNLQLKAQLDLADKKIRIAMANYAEAPVQVKAASDAYLQKSVLYKNGLTTLVDLTQTLYTLNRAESDRDIAYSNIWQALLLKSAAIGDFSIFIDEF